MPLISNRAKHISVASTVKAIAAANERRGGGRNVVTLATGSPCNATADEIGDAAIDFIRRREIGSRGAEGTPELKAALGKKLLEENGLPFDVDQIVVSHGTKPLITAALFAITDPGDEVIIPAPYFVSYPEIARIVGAIPVIVDTLPADNFILTADRLRDAISDRTRAILLSNPNNPAGSIYGAGAWEAVAEVLALYPKVHIVVDEIFEHVHFEAAPVSPARAVPALADRVIVVNGFSKGYSMNNWRIGFAAGPRELIRRVAGIVGHTTGAPSLVAQAGALAALEASGKILPADLDALRIARDRTVEAINAIEGLRVHKPDGTFFLFPSCEGLYGRTSAGGTRIDSDETFAAALFDEADVAVVPGRGFGRAGHFRLSFAPGWPEVEEGLQRIGRFVQSAR